MQSGEETTNIPDDLNSITVTRSLQDSAHASEAGSSASHARQSPSSDQPGSSDSHARLPFPESAPAALSGPSGVQSNQPSSSSNEGGPIPIHIQKGYAASDPGPSTDAEGGFIDEFLSGRMRPGTQAMHELDDPSSYAYSDPGDKRKNVEIPQNEPSSSDGDTYQAFGNAYNPHEYILSTHVATSHFLFRNVIQTLVSLSLMMLIEKAL